MDFSKLKTYSIARRKNKVDKALFARVLKKGATFEAFMASLPNILKSKDLREIVDAVASARSKGKPVMLLMGAHVIKCGLSPVVIDLIERGIVTSVAFNGAGIIHDFEISYCGSTSEDVAHALKAGSFGMVRETAEYLNAAISEGVQEGRGLGESVGLMIERRALKYKKLSIAYACVKKGVPLTVHVAIGTDIIHQHQSANGSETGEATMRDFRKMCVEVAGLDNGGVVLNFGSAVILPEVFLKSLSVARNLTKRVARFTTANFDMNIHYRPMQNVVVRPVQGSGRGYYIVGHHEIMLPLLAQAIKEKL
ncbi:MAG TPA: hypothetical protein DCL35_02785 [Candidatus Omnitrophica bacterium]|nr:hypothetical protein [Candidatus Omnitrophota bacterium]